MAGVDLLAIKELGGWKSLTMVQRYAHLSPTHRSQAIERLVTRTVDALTHARAGAEIAPGVTPAGRAIQILCWKAVKRLEPGRELNPRPSDYEEPP
jgi:hypothetical protein